MCLGGMPGGSTGGALTLPHMPGSQPCCFHDSPRAETPRGNEATATLGHLEDDNQPAPGAASGHSK